MERNQITYFSKHCTCHVPTVVSLDNNETNPYDIVNTLNNYFASIAEATKKSIKYLDKHFADYFSNETSSTIFL